MRGKTVLMTAVLGFSLCCIFHAQKKSSLIFTDQQNEDHSPYRGRPIKHSEALSGLWEAPDGHGGAVGIYLQLGTSVPGTAMTLRGTPQSWESLQVGVYERHGPVIQIGSGNGFSDSPRGSNLKFEDGRLTVHSFAYAPGTTFVDLDLVQQPGDRWYGRLHRGHFDAQVTLRRPAAPDSQGANQLIGTWSESTAFGGACVHIAGHGPDDFTGWSDALQTWGSVMFAPHVVRPSTAFQRYGDLMNVHRGKNGSVSFELYAYNGLCCPKTFDGILSKDGSTMEGSWSSGSNRAVWTKMRGDSCVTSEPVSAKMLPHHQP